MAVEDDPAIIGKVFDVTEAVPVTAEQIKQYCEAIGETNPLFTDEAAASEGPYGKLCAPPSFAATFRSRRGFWELMPRFGLGRGGFDAGKDMEFFRPIGVGDKITLSSQVKEIYEKTGRSGTMVFLVFRSTLKNQDGEIVAHVDHRFMHRK
ncbi:MAG: MaoC family dehydratase N-terminal domain-containing protein [Candidatus Binataceae bacterium]